MSKYTKTARGWATTIGGNVWEIRKSDRHPLRVYAYAPLRAAYWAVYCNGRDVAHSTFATKAEAIAHIAARAPTR